MKKLMLLALGLLSAVGVEARSWGFDKDTVYESRPGGDTLWLVNNGPDTLRLDSVFAEGIDTPYWLDVGFLYRKLEPPPFSYQSYGLIQGVSISKQKMAGDRIPPGASILLRDFGVHSASVTKRTATWAAKDSLQVRLRFKSTLGAEDTLIVRGFIMVGTSIRSHLRPNPTQQPNIKSRDAQGRTTTQSTRHLLLK